MLYPNPALFSRGNSLRRHERSGSGFVGRPFHARRDTIRSAQTIFFAAIYPTQVSNDRPCPPKSAAANSLPLARCKFGSILLCPHLHDSGNQRVGDRLVIRKSQIALRSRVFHGFTFQLRIVHRRVQTQVSAERTHIDERAVQRERGHAVADDLRMVVRTLRRIFRTFGSQAAI